MAIWDFREIKKSVSDLNPLLTLGEGSTPFERITLDGIGFVLKREDLNPTGSWKDRGTAYRMSLLKEKNIKEAVISSSGNAAISYLEYAKLYPELKLHIVISPNAKQEKSEKIEQLIQGTYHQLYISNIPKSTRAKIISETGATNLAASLDQEILKGYWSLGFEIKKYIKSLNAKISDFALFVPVSSGTTFVGLTMGIFMQSGNEYEVPQMFVCQTTQVHPCLTDTPNEESEKSLADAIIDKTCLRLPQINKILNETNGMALAITNEELKTTENKLATIGVEGLSYTSMLSIAGALRLTGQLKDKKIMCITSGQ